MPGQRTFWVVAAFAVGVAFIPVKSLNCPDWEVWVTDPRGQPVSGVTIRLTFRNYSREREFHEIDAVTGAQGHVAFSAQTLSTSFASCLVATLSSALAGPHASFGPHASVFAFGNGLEGSAIDKQNRVVDWTGKPRHMESRIIVQ
jgi:hypothetical protein